jgi:WD40 repeat protein
VTSIGFSPDGKYALSGSEDATLKLWDIESGRELRTFVGHHDWVNAVAFSPDGKRVVSGSRDRTVKLWDVGSGRELRTLSNGGFVESVAFSPDGVRILSNDGKAICLWDVESGRKLRTLPTDDYVSSLVFSMDGNRILSTGGDKVRLWDLERGTEIREFFLPLTSWQSTFTAVFSPDGKSVLSGGTGNNDVTMWDIESGREVRTFIGAQSAITSLAFLPDGKRLMATSMDGTMRSWNFANGNLAATSASRADGEWITITPEGYYVASPKGDSLLNVRIGNDFYGIDQWRASFDRPSLVEAALRMEGAGLPSPTTALSAGNPETILPPLIRVDSPTDGQSLSGPSAQLKLHIEDYQRPIQTVSVAINGRRFSTGGENKPTLTIPAGRKTLDLEVPIELERGDNIVEIIAASAVAQTKRQVLLSTTSAQAKGSLPVLWILAIGINQYSDHTWLQPLHFAADDAESIMHFYEQQEGRLFSRVHSRLITDTATLKPTRGTILDNLSFLRNAGSNDVAMLFISGHGAADTAGRFSLLPSDTKFDQDGNPLRSSTISAADIREVLDLPSKRLLIVDTCHAGGVKGPEAKAPDANQLVRDLQGLQALIFASSRGAERSQEDSQRRHGAFTAALIEGLSGKNGIHYAADGALYMKDLDAYVSRRVPEITGGAQHPITDAPDGYANFPIAIVQ